MENLLEEAKIEAGRSGGEVTDFYVHTNYLGFLLNVHFDSVGLGGAYDTMFPTSS